MQETWDPGQPARVRLALLNLTEDQESQVEEMLENEYWRGYMDGETDTYARQQQER